MRTTFLKIILAGVLYSPNVWCQVSSQQQHEMVKEMFYQLKGMKQYGYKYSLVEKFPDGTTDQTQGELFMNTDTKTMFTNGDVSTTLLTDSWYLMADHHHKTIMIANINKKSEEHLKKQVAELIFGNSVYVDGYVDSAILPLGIIKNFRQTGDTVRCTITFPAQLQIKSIDLVYDYTHKMPVSYAVKMFYPWDIKDKRYKEKGITKILSCYDYKKDIDKSKYDVHNYFIVSNGKAILKKYKGYTLKTDL
jgi:hypothetical protein